MKRMPGFTAAASLKTAKGHYAASALAPADGVVPSYAIANYLLPGCPLGSWPCYRIDSLGHLEHGCCALVTHW
jgi:hypothetical protein